LGPITAEFGDRSLAFIERGETIAWAESKPTGVVAVAVGLFGLAVDEELIDRNPFRGLVRRGDGRSPASPPTPDQSTGYWTPALHSVTTPAKCARSCLSAPTPA
jgi:hypothetical protein